MKSRIVDLSSKPRASVTVELGGKSFKISRVVTGVRQLYGRFLTDAGDMMLKAAEVGERIQAMTIATPEQLEKATAEVAERTEDIEAFASEKVDILLRCIELLLTKNGHEFDRAWWIDNGDETDYQSLIVEAIQKDSEPGQKKTAEPAG